MEIKEYLKEELGKDLKFSEPMKKHTWIQIGGPAEFFYAASNLDDLIKAIKICQKKKIPYLVIGEGSNLIVSDEGLEGLVIKNEASNLIFEKNLAFVESGITLHVLIRKLAESNLGGLEFLAGIPGTLGGAIYGNAGAYGKSMSDLVKHISLLDAVGEIRQLEKKDFNFAYRESILKSKSKIAKIYYNRPVILSAALEIRPNNKDGILRMMENYLKIKIKKIPKEASAGCVFKNFEIKDESIIDPQLKIFAEENKIPAGLLIDKAGAKSERMRGVRVSEKHANFIVNLGRGKAVDFVKLANIIKEKVRKKFGVNLEEEIEYLGEIDITKKGILAKVFKK